MSIPPAQQEIDSILKTLSEAEQGSGLSHDDPAVIALEQIMLAKVAALEGNTVRDTEVPDATPALDPTKEQDTSPEPPLLFATDEVESGQ